MKILDIAYNSEGEPNESGIRSHAKLINDPRANLPKAFTICNSMRVMAWTTKSYTVAYPFIMKQNDGSTWWSFYRFYAKEASTVYTVYYNPWQRVDAPIEGPMYFPQEWVRSCVSLEPDSGTIRIVVNGELVEDAVNNTKVLSSNETDSTRPTNLTGLSMAEWGTTAAQFADVNVYSTFLSVEKLVNLTTPGHEDCMSPGDYLSWGDSNWKVFNKAEMLWVDLGVGPCAPKSKVQVFRNEGHQSNCMELCQKVGSGQSPPLRTLEEWESLTKEIDNISPNSFGYTWLAATEGDIGTTLDMAFRI